MSEKKSMRIFRAYSRFKIHVGQNLMALSNLKCLFPYQKPQLNLSMWDVFWCVCLCVCVCVCACWPILWPLQCMLASPHSVCVCVFVHVGQSCGHWRACWPTLIVCVCVFVHVGQSCGHCNACWPTLIVSGHQVFAT